MIKKSLRNNVVRFTLTIILSLAYSVLRETEYSTLVKPLPIIFWLIVILNSDRIRSSRWVIASLSLALIGDILLDLGDQWLQVGSIPFLISTALLGWAFHRRLIHSTSKTTLKKKFVVLTLTGISFIVLYLFLISYSTEAALIGGVLFSISALLITASLNNFLFNSREKEVYLIPLLGLVGACGIVLNYVFYSIDLYVMSIPRDVVIQVYYWGTALATWSFLDRTDQDMASLASN